MKWGERRRGVADTFGRSWPYPHFHRWRGVHRAASCCACVNAKVLFLDSGLLGRTAVLHWCMGAMWPQCWLWRAATWGVGGAGRGQDSEVGGKTLGSMLLVLIGGRTWEAKASRWPSDASQGVAGERRALAATPVPPPREGSLFGGLGLASFSAATSREPSLAAGLLIVARS